MDRFIGMVQHGFQNRVLPGNLPKIQSAAPPSSTIVFVEALYFTLFDIAAFFPLPGAEKQDRGDEISAGRIMLRRIKNPGEAISGAKEAVIAYRIKPFR
jgi:hypothetical protein